MAACDHAQAAWCDAKAFYDTERTATLKLRLNWSRALACGLREFILKSDDGTSGDAGLDETFDELWKERDALVALFDHFSSIGGDAAVRGQSAPAKNVLLPRATGVAQCAPAVPRRRAPS